MEKESWKKALSEVMSLRRGNLQELEGLIGKDYIREFKKGGLINFGCSATERTWRISNLGDTFIREMNLCTAD